MAGFQIRRALPASLAIAIACAAGPPDQAAVATTRQEIAQAMDRYMVAARAVDPDAIAAFYTETGTLFEPGMSPVETRAAIRAFMASFPGVRVEVATATPDAIEVFGDTVLLWGSYFERLAFPGQPVSEQRGKFVAEWVRQPDHTWLIERLFRVPVSTQLPGGAQ